MSGMMRNLMATPFVSKAPGAIAMPLNVLLESLVNVRTFGAKGDGVTDDSAAIQAWLEYLMASGERGAVGPGQFYMDEPLSVQVTGNLNVLASPHAKFVGSPGISQNMILLLATAATAEQYEINWRGGEVDFSKTIYVPGTLSGSGLALQWVWKSRVRGVKFTGPADYTQGGAYGGDTGLTLVSCQYIDVQSNFFSGVRDTGIYITGDSNTADDENDGRDIIVAGNQFIKCAAGVSVKRQSHRTLISGNIFDWCEAGVALVTTDVVKPDPPAGGGAHIVGNSFSRTGRNAIDVRYSNIDGTFITGNRIQDFGYGLDGVTPVANPTAILLEGASDTFIKGNKIAMKEWTRGGSHVGVLMQGFTYNGTLYGCDDNTVTGNKLKGLDIGFRETPGQVTNSTYILNPCTNVTQKYNNIQTGSGSTTFEQDAGTWTATLYDAANGGNASPTTVTGSYVKTGNMVTATFSMAAINTTGMTAASPVYIALPFASPAGMGAVGSILLSNVAMPSSTSSVSMTLPAGQSRALITATGSNVGNKSVAVSNLTSGTSGIVQASITYEVAPQ